MTLLDSLRKHSKVVADTGDFAKIAQYSPSDATTNPSLIMKASQLDEYKYLIDDAVSYGKKSGTDHQQRAMLQKTFVNFGLKILELVPGRVSTEVDPRLSFNVEQSVLAARSIIKLYEENNVDRSRVLIKLAATWEGVQTAKILEKEGIHCNMTLIFSLEQAVACAEAKATLISPFVGRIYDWYVNSTGKEYSGKNDPGVLSVQAIYEYYKKFGYTTEIMGASFRNIDQIIALAGCDLITISPDLLEELQSKTGNVPCELSPKKAAHTKAEKIILPEGAFRHCINENQMATEKLSEGIRNFVADIQKLEKFLMSK